MNRWWMALVVLASAGIEAHAANRLPHIVLYVGDDLGMGDIGAYDPRSKIPTPELDRMAREGARFYDVHSPAAVCTPTRYGLLTGKYPFRSRLDRGVLFSAYDMALLKGETDTIAALLRRAGFATAGFGKWHVGIEARNAAGTDLAKPGAGSSRFTTKDVDLAQPLRHGPVDHGFDFFFGLASSLNHEPYAFLENDRVLPTPTRMRAEFTPERGSGVFREGWVADGWDDPETCPRILARASQHIRQRLTREPQKPLFVYYASPAPHFPWVPPKTSFGRAVKGQGGTDDASPLHNDMVVHNDVEVGELRRALEDPNGDGRTDDSVLENTLFIVTSDNGACVGYLPPYRDHKASIYEGGHRVPFIVRWPQHVRAGTRNDALFGLQDLFATFAAIAGVAPAKDSAVDSQNMLSALKGSSPGRDELLVQQAGASRVFALRSGAWKLIAQPGKPPELYDLATDLGETNNLAISQTERLRKMQARLLELVGKQRL
jgi:arylsulfatase A